MGTVPSNLLASCENFNEIMHVKVPGIYKTLDEVAREFNSIGRKNKYLGRPHPTLLMHTSFAGPSDSL